MLLAMRKYQCSTLIKISKSENINIRGTCTYVFGNYKSFFILINVLESFRNVKKWVFEKFFPHAFHNFFYQKVHGPTVLEENSCFFSKNLLIILLKLSVGWLSRDQRFLCPWALRGKSGAELAILYPLLFILVKSEHEQLNISLVEVHLLSNIVI